MEFGFNATDLAVFFAQRDKTRDGRTKARYILPSYGVGEGHWDTCRLPAIYFSVHFTAAQIL